MVSWARRLTRVLPPRTGTRVVAGTIALLLVAGLTVYFATRDTGTAFHTENRMITVRTGPAGDRPVPLDTTLYLPDTATGAHPAPAVLMPHGFGGDKTSVADDAKELARQGYVVLAWSAEGFGRSGGQIHLDSPDWEVTDARRLVDWLGRRPDVRRDGPDDPRVGVVGSSYGGGLALLLAGYDRRVDAIVPQATWNDLGRSLFPDAAGGPVTGGVPKRAWLGVLFEGAFGPAGTDRSGTGSAGRGGRGGGGGDGPAARSQLAQCGRFSADVCRLYQQSVTAGRASPESAALLARSSPATVLNRIKAPTLLVQGLSDSLFPLGEADANARGIGATGTPVRVAWFSGGHDGGDGSTADHDRVRYLTLQWLDHHLRGRPLAAGPAFTFSRITGYDTYSGTIRTTGLGTDRYPGLAGDRPARTVRLAGGPQPVANPPDGTPTAVSSLPGAGALAVAGAPVPGTGTEVPGQFAGYESGRLTAPLDLAGAPKVAVRAVSPTGEAVLFVKLYDVAPTGRSTLVGGQVAAVRLTGLPAGTDPAGYAAARPVTVTLNGMVYRFGAGHRVRLVLATSDQAYAGPAQPASYLVGLAGGALTVPQVAAGPITDPAGVWLWVLLALVVAVLPGVAGALLVARYRRHRRRREVVAGFADTPLRVRGLRKTYRDGFVAVRGVDFEVRRGQVVGLLGPNGAGKTTSLRMLLGLIRPTGGEVLVFGHRVTAGAPVLSRIGSLVEGPGFLPHLSGVDNLRMYWRSVGRPWRDARFDQVLAIADLGDAVHRKVRTYSHGMKQRLAIAQAMLGMPELLVLDEPTDGLDPPQIAEMRRVLQRYAGTGGRAVLVSSHLLAEVEQTCTHVVVMHRGELVASGPVTEIVGDSPSVLVSVSDVDRAEPVLAGLPGIGSVARQNGGFVVDLAGGSRRELVAALVSAGVGVDRVVPRRRLEDAFLALLERES